MDERRFATKGSTKRPRADRPTRTVIQHFDFWLFAFISSTIVKRPNIKLSIIALFLFDSLIFYPLTKVLLINANNQKSLCRFDFLHLFWSNRWMIWHTDALNFDQLISTVFSADWFGVLIFDVLIFGLSIRCHLSLLYVLIQYLSLEIKHSVFGDLTVYSLFDYTGTRGSTSSHSPTSFHNIYRY